MKKQGSRWDNGIAGGQVGSRRQSKVWTQVVQLLRRNCFQNTGSQPSGFLVLSDMLTLPHIALPPGWSCRTYIRT